jgi:hypothetical protein
MAMIDINNPESLEVIYNLEDILKEMTAAKIYYESIVYAAYRYPWADYPEDLGSTPKQRFRDMAEQNLREAGYLSPYRRKTWRITEDRKLALDRAIRFMLWANNSGHEPNEGISKDIKILKSMIEESGGESGIQH